MGWPEYVNSSLKIISFEWIKRESFVNEILLKPRRHIVDFEMRNHETTHITTDAKNQFMVIKPFGTTYPS